jgi:hypothetical protein
VDGNQLDCWKKGIAMKPHKHADLIKAWADGAEIQVKNHLNEWQDSFDPRWMTSIEYRIKPQPKPDVVQFWCASCEPLKRPLENNLKLTFDGETGKLKSAEVL